MELNNIQHKSFLWHLDIEPFAWHTFYGEQCPSFVTEENKEAWKRYLTKIIKKHLNAEAMATSEFQEIEMKIREEKLLQFKSDEQRKRMMEFSRTLPSSLTLKGGSTSIPKPLSPQEQGDVAGDAIALPEFLHRQRSLWISSAALGNLKASFHCTHLHELCPQGADDNRLRNRVAIFYAV